MLRRIENKIPPRTTVIMSSWKASFLLWNISFFRIAASYSYRELCDCRRISKNGKPTSLRDLGFRLQRFATEGFNSGKRGIDIIRRDVNQHLAKFIATCCFTHLDKTTTRTRISLEHVVVKRWIDLEFPIKQICIEFACGCRVSCRDFNVNNRML